MKALTLKISAVASLLASLLLWMQGGARSGFYQDLRRVRQFDDILQIEYYEEVKAFLPGVETLFVGFVLFVALLAASRFFDAKTISKTEPNHPYKP